MKRKVAVMGAGSWGTALAVTLAKNGHQVSMWDINAAHIQDMREQRENRRFLPGVPLPEGIRPVDEKTQMLQEADLLLFSVPAQHFRTALEGALDCMNPDALVVNVAKGIEQKSLMRLSQIAAAYRDDLRYVVLSGPSHAEEVGLGLPTTIAAAAKDRAWAQEAQDVFMNDYLRIYTNDDVVGMELGGSLKNIIALGAGISDGLGYGDNAKAALMTRGMTEIMRLGVRLGAEACTFAGLSGMGDLIVTCTSMHSRNRRCGMLIGQGVPVEEAIQEVGMVVEGIYTTDAAYRLAQEVGVAMPITETIYRIIRGELQAEEASALLMKRDRGHEMEDLFRS